MVPTPESTPDAPTDEVRPEESAHRREVPDSGPFVEFIRAVPTFAGAAVLGAVVYGHAGAAIGAAVGLVLGAFVAYRSKG